jgi:hypothetical protein
MAINPSALANTSSVLLPPTITGPIFAKAAEQSAVMSLARRVPLSVAANTAIPVPMDIPIADWVGEGGVKPAAQGGVGVKLMSGKKLALLVPVSDEVVMTNPGGLYSQLQQDLPTALSRAFDYAAITGKSLKTGGAGPFQDYIAMTPNTVQLGTATQGTGGIYNDLVTGVGKIVDSNYDMTGWAADPRLQVDAMLATDTTGRPLLSNDHSTSTNDETGNMTRDLLGWPAVFNKGVGGRYWRAGDALQTITISGTPTGGTFTVAAGGNSYTAAYNVATATLQGVIQGWGGVFSTVTVSGSAGTSYVITFPAITSNVAPAAAPFTVNGANLTGGSSPKATVVASGQGGVDSTIRAVAGDWSQCAYGVGMDITFKVSTEASYFDGTNWHSSFQENLTLLLVEAFYGFVVGSPSAFTVFTKGSVAF